MACCSICIVFAVSFLSAGSRRSGKNPFMVSCLFFIPLPEKNKWY